MLPFPFPLSWEMTTGLIYYLSFNSMFYTFFFLHIMYTPTTYSFEILHKQNCIVCILLQFFPQHCFSDVSSCRSNLFNHLIFKPLTSIALFTCPVKKYPTYQSPRLSDIVHKNFTDFFFSNRMWSFPLLNSIILFILVCL